MRILRTVSSAVVACLAAGAMAAGGGISLDLNKLEAADDGCRMHMVVTNHTARTYENFLLDLVIFDSAGVIARRTAVDVSPVRPDKTSVYAFSVKDLRCEQFGRVLLNEVTGCQVGADAAASCTAEVTVSSKAGVELFK